jgi:nitrogen-specific signal transduction histidine kinase
MPDQPKRPRPRGGRRQPPGEENRLFRHIVSSMRNGVLAVHRNGTLALMNDEAYRIFSMSANPDDIGRPFTDVLRTRADVVRVLTAAFELNHLPNRAELRLKELDRVIGYTLSLVKDDTADTVGAVMFFKDLTRVEQLEERERLRDRLASLGEMAAGIAHELKNPLAGIEVMAGLLRRQVQDKVDAQSILADIISEAKLANAIVVEMLEFVRPVRLEIEPMAIADVLHQAINLAETKTTRGGVSVTMVVPEGLPTIEADRNRLCQVFTNLIANAFEALDGTGAVTITAALGAMEADPAFAGTPQEPTPILMVDVADNGPGVPAELNDRIFDPFFTTKTKGTGLGLGIVRKIVDAHDGRIDLNSSPEMGTRFRVTLPVSSATTLFK